MAVEIEPFADARARIREAGYEVIGVRRLPRYRGSRPLNARLDDVEQISRMMIGIGMPISQRSTPRMVDAPWLRGDAA